jgi:carboxyl-terminal processing protease
MIRKNNKNHILISVAFAVFTFALGWFVGVRGIGSEAVGTLSGGKVDFSAVLQKAQSSPGACAQGCPNIGSGAVDWDTFSRVWKELNSKFVEQPLDQQGLFYGALKGLAAAANDPYTVFLPPPDNQRLKDNLNGRYEGIGAELGMRDNQLAVIAPLDGSPAQAAGLKAGDKILKVDGEETGGMTLSEAVGKIRGPAGEAVVLNLRRDGGDPFDLTIVRAQITVKSVKWEDKGDGLVYIRVSRFGEQTARDWDNAVGEITSQNPSVKAIILDVRSNPGGYLQASIHIASEFIPQGVVVSEQFGDGTKRDFKANRRGKLVGVPVVVLIDEGSASASEILAGALRDQLGAKLVGKKSFGKGTVQDSIEFKDKSSLHVTIAYWLTPNGDKINGKGLTPDVEVALDEEKFKQDNVDTQLERALEIARGL